MEDAHLRLAALHLHNPLMGRAALAQHLQRHYMRALLPELYKVRTARPGLACPGVLGL